MEGVTTIVTAVATGALAVAGTVYAIYTRNLVREMRRDRQARFLPLIVVVAHGVYDSGSRRGINLVLVNHSDAPAIDMEVRGPTFEFVPSEHTMRCLRPREKTTDIRFPLLSAETPEHMPVDVEFWTADGNRYRVSCQVKKTAEGLVRVAPDRPETFILSGDRWIPLEVAWGRSQQ